MRTQAQNPASEATEKKQAVADGGPVSDRGGRHHRRRGNRTGHRQSADDEQARQQAGIPHGQFHQVDAAKELRQGEHGQTGQQSADEVGQPREQFSGDDLPIAQFGDEEKLEHARFAIARDGVGDHHGRNQEYADGLHREAREHEPRGELLRLARVHQRQFGERMQRVKAPDMTRVTDEQREQQCDRRRAAQKRMLPAPRGRDEIVVEERPQRRPPAAGAFGGYRVSGIGYRGRHG